MQDPFKVFKRGNWVSDNLGNQVPMGSHSDAKEFLQLPQDVRKFLTSANTLVRGNLSKELWTDLAMLISIAGDHDLTKRFVVSVVAGSMSQDGQASTNALQAMVQMLAMNALSPAIAHPQRQRGNGHKETKEGGRISFDSE